MADFIDERGRWVSIRHESSHPRGYYRRCEPRPGVTSEDPWRYRHRTIDQLRQAGDIDPGTPDTLQVRGDLYAAAWGEGLSSPRRARLLGAFREVKQAAYYGRRKDLEDALLAAGVDDGEAEAWLDAWDDGRDLRVVHAPGGRRGNVAVVQDGQVLVELNARQFSRGLAELGDYLEDWEKIEGRSLEDATEAELLEALEGGDLF